MTQTTRRSGEEAPALAAWPAVPKPVARRRRVLIVEDNVDAAESLRLLMDLLGHDARVASTGTDGLRVATAWRPDVVVSDIGLPGLDGYALAAELRRRPETTHALLVAVTGYGSDDSRRMAHRSGFQHVFTKPADPAVLLDLLAAPGT